ncbi:hypothetical protein ACEPAF_1781 [Sanghuangporus sanghuang]
MANFVASIKAWTSVDSTIRWTTASDAPRLWEPLLNPWLLVKNTVEKRYHEAPQHPLLDAMMHLIFHQSVQRDDERYEGLFDASLALPLPNATDAPVVLSTTADTIVMKEPPLKTQTDILDTLGLEHIGMTSHVECLLSPLETLHLGIFPLEAKRSNYPTALHHIAMDLCSIQYQRRILCLKPRHVYGATCVGGKFRLYVSMWRIEDVIFVRPIRKCIWELKDPAQFIQCLYFLRALKSHLDQGMQDDFNSFNEQKLRESLGCMPIWRTEREDAEDDSDDGLGSGRSGGTCDGDTTYVLV